MKYFPLLWAALRRRRVRSIFTLLSITIAFLLVGIMTSLSASFAQIIDRAPMDRIHVMPRYGAWMPIANLDQIARVDGVTQIVSMAFMGGFYQDRSNGVGVILSDERAATIIPESNVSPQLFAELKQVQDGAIVNQFLSDHFGWKVGDIVPLQTDRDNRDGTRVWTFRIVAIVPNGENQLGGFMVGNFAYLNEGRGDGRKDEVNRIQLLISDAQRAGETSNAIERLFANSSTPVLATPERTLFENNLQGVLDMEFLTFSVSAAGLFMILFLTGNVMAQSVRERIPEFATMKAIGFSDNGIFALVLAEAAVLCLIGAGLGLLLASFTPTFASMALPGAPMPVITPGVVGFALFCALVVAVVSGLPGAWHVKRLSIAEALGGR